MEALSLSTWNSLLIFILFSLPIGTWRQHLSHLPCYLEASFSIFVCQAWEWGSRSWRKTKFQRMVDQQRKRNELPQANLRSQMSFLWPASKHSPWAKHPSTWVLGDKPILTIHTSYTFSPLIFFSTPFSLSFIFLPNPYTKEYSLLFYVTLL